MNYPIDLKSKAVDVHMGADARRRLLAGAHILAKCVGVTYGPGGRVVMLDRPHGLLATKDGVTVAREVEVEDPVSNLGCQILKTACIKVNDEVGDGTTSTAVIAEAILREGHKLIEAGAAPVMLQRGLQAAAAHCAEFIATLAIPVEDQSTLERVAMIASNGDEEVSQKMAEGCMAVGKDGTLTIEDGNSVGIELVFKEGMEIDRGVASNHQLKGQNERVLETPLVAVIGQDLRTVADIRDLLEVASQWPDHELLIIAQNIEGEALKTVVMNDNAGVMRAVAITAPGFHDRKKDSLKDLAALTGADYVDPLLGYDITKWDPEWFGGLKKATIEAKKSIFVGYDEAEEGIEERIAQVKAEKRQARSEYDIDKINERIAKLSGGLCIMMVGGYTETEMKERRARIEDALGSVQAALRSGVVPGAGSTYLACSYSLAQADVTMEDVDFQSGWGILMRALQRPLQVLVSNAGGRADYLVDCLRARFEEDGEFWTGWDVSTGGLRHLGEGDLVVDPQAVSLCVIEAAVSAAGTLLTVEASLSQVR